MIYKVGLTGGIGSGKSTVAGLFAKLGTPVLDADVIARELVVPGAPALARIVEAFGADIITAQGALDRPRLRRIIFSDPARRKALEAILHPPIRAAMRERVDKLAGPYCVLCVPLLLETGQETEVDRILVVDTPHSLQYRRVMARDGLSAAEAAAMLRAQIGWCERLARADDVIVNDKGLAELERRVSELDRLYRDLGRESLPARAK
ncbi:MAG: dephospho-CoA kinase [Gammaproteobacteria bacterium]|nr:dephospho-CoA kinase [Gammaproteobacteria bacterium]